VNIPLLGLTALLVITSGFFINDAFAEINENSAYLIEGSGFAVTEKIIRISEIDIGLSSHQKSGSSIDFLIEDGFITLDNEDFVISELEGKFLREGRYIRINGNIEGAQSQDASVYGFTGRITTIDNSYKIIYTAKLSQLTKIVETIETSSAEEILTIRILPGSSTQGITSSYIPSGEVRDPRVNVSTMRLGYYSQDRITLEPGTSVIFLNEDDVPHSIESGKENYGDRHNPYTPDGRIATEDIKPGESLTITFDEMGFYRLYDPSYPWMEIIVYSFPNVDNLILGTTKNQQGN
jgi:plastocyanin